MSEPKSEPVRDVPIRDDSIRLGQFMKLADLIDRGSDAKAELAADAVTVNGVVESRRGRQLHPGDTVAVAARSARIVRSTEVG